MKYFLPLFALLLMSAVNVLGWSALLSSAVTPHVGMLITAALMTGASALLVVFAFWVAAKDPS